jgi:hypothetical protein
MPSCVSQPVCRDVFEFKYVSHTGHCSTLGNSNDVLSSPVFLIKRRDIVFGIVTRLWDG